jgi:Zn finger protein HypA/HybF involved in hydrogenase expression
VHELSLVADLVRTCIERAGAGGQVATVHVRHASTLPREVLEEAFVLLTRGTVLAGAQLDATPLERPFRCPGCGFRGALRHDDVIGGAAVCPGCGQPSPLAGGPELELLGLS